MSDKNLIKVGVRDNSTDWGIVGHATTERGAIRIGKCWGSRHTVNNPGYAGYRYTITLHIDGEMPRQVRV